MARPRKRGLDYFTNDVNFYQDIRIRKLIHHRGIHAVAVYHIILCKIYAEGYYVKWDEDFPFIVHEVCGLQEDMISDIISYCIEIGLFSRVMFKSFRVLTSKGIQERFFAINSAMKRKTESNYEYSLLLTETGPVLQETLPVSSEETTAVSEETRVTSGETLPESTFLPEKVHKGKKRKDNLSSLGYQRPHARGDGQEIWSDDDQRAYDSIDDEVAVLKGSPLWKEQVLMRFRFLGFSDELLGEYLDRWSLELKGKGKVHQFLGDAKSHFVNWMIIQEDKYNKNHHGHGADNNNGYRSGEEILNGALSVIAELRREGRHPQEPLPVV